jgi:hypothetical protein
VSSESFWIVGPTRSGKTARLVAHYTQWATTVRTTTPVAVFAANGENRRDLVDRLFETGYAIPLESHTPLGFFQRDVMLFWPLLAQTLNLAAPFPLRLRPETEQVLATQRWQPLLDDRRLYQDGTRPAMMVRRTLDLWQLAALAGIPIAEIPARLEAGLGDLEGSADLWQTMGEALQDWRHWCLERGLLTYSLITELYGQYLLPHPHYQTHLRSRYAGILADDVDDYPALMADLFTVLLDGGCPMRFTFNPDGGTRQGLGADPDCLSQLSHRCQSDLLPPNPQTLGDRLGIDQVHGWLADPLWLEMPETVQSIQTTARGTMLRQVAECIATAIHRGQVTAPDIAILGPGLDAIARYTLREILQSRGIELLSLQDQRPLVSYPKVRSLLTLLALIYPGLGPLIRADDVAELLVVLSQPTDRDRPTTDPAIDPVRAGLITDHCFIADVDHPQLADVTAFPRWDRLGYRATTAYHRIRQWITDQRHQRQQSLLPNPIQPMVILDRAIQHFFAGGTALPYDQLAALRELMETAQHYWDVDGRLRQTQSHHLNDAQVVGEFIDLLQRGTITADPYPVRPVGQPAAVTLATLFQYRTQRCRHRWHFWLDAGSSLWLTGGGPLLGAPLFRRTWDGQPWTAADRDRDDTQRLHRQIIDLLRRVSDRLYLCHSDLATNGQEQIGPLLPWVNAAAIVDPLEAPIPTASP